jgi:acetoin utilization deacetylase AcuC-like enzyme
LRVLQAHVDAVPGLVRIGARAATDAEIGRVHSAALIERVEATRGAARTHFDPDTSASAESCEAARLAAGGLVDLCEAVCAGEIANGLALVRPPGHHAERDRAMGFCLFNNVAIAAQALRARGLARVAVVDWDLHHGNGTQHAFEDDPDVLYVSTHQYPFYPGTGAAEEIGRGPGVGATLNLPCPAGFGVAELGVVFVVVIGPALRRFAPDFVLVSAGFDCDGRDPLGGLRLTPAGVAKMARVCAAVAREVAGGRLVAVLEGGYDLDALTDGVGVVLQEWQAGDQAVPAPVTGDGRRAAPLVEHVQRLHAPHG